MKRHEKQYAISCDLIRVFAVVCVIWTHTVQKEMEAEGIPAAGDSILLTILWVCPMVCNVLYIMLSGALLYPYKDESVGVFYRRRFVTAALPMFLCYAVFYVAGGWMGSSPRPLSLKGYFVNLLTGNTPEAPYYWLICLVLSVYITAPFFRILLRNMTYRNISIFAGILMAFLTVKYVLRAAGMEMAVSVPMSDWLTVSILGYWVSRQETRRYDRGLAWAGIAGAVIVLAVILSGADGTFLSIYCCNQSPLCVAEGLALFPAAARAEKVCGGRAARLFRAVSKYSYGMILVHWGVLCVGIRKVLKIAVEYGYSIYGVIAVSITLNLLISYVLSVLLNKFLFLPLQKRLGGAAAK